MLKIDNPSSGAAAFQVRLARAGEESTVAACSIDDLHRQGDDSMPLAVELDIEGSQATLFQAHTGWVGQAHLITLELDNWLMPWAGSSRSFFLCLNKYSFKCLLSAVSNFLLLRCSRMKVFCQLPVGAT